jgi:hypothetical protein
MDSVGLGVVRDALDPESLPNCILNEREKNITELRVFFVLLIEEKGTYATNSLLRGFAHVESLPLSRLKAFQVKAESIHLKSKATNKINCLVSRAVFDETFDAVRFGCHSSSSR